MTSGLVHLGYSLPEGQAGKLNFFVPCEGVEKPEKLRGKTRKVADSIIFIQSEFYPITCELSERGVVRYTTLLR